MVSLRAGAAARRDALAREPERDGAGWSSASRRFREDATQRRLDPLGRGERAVVIVTAGSELVGDVDQATRVDCEIG